MPRALWFIPLVLPALAGPCLAQAQTEPTQGDRTVTAARELLGQPYRFGGRLTGPGAGVDCQGLLFYAAERIGRCGWRSFSVMPTRSIPSGELGRSVVGLAPVATADLDPAKLLPGDVLWLLSPIENPAEPSLTKLGDEPVWVWHTGLYAGGGRLLHADPFGGRVVEEALLPFLETYGYAGLWVTRLTAAPAPKRCRRHPPMPRPAPPAPTPSSSPSSGR
jgi:hypothetical protein